MQQTTSQNINPGQSDRITVDEIVKREKAGEQFTFVDVRGADAWDSSDEKVPGAIRMTLDHPDQVSDINRDKPVITYCT